MEEKDFDSLVRSTMAEGTESVPAGMWDALQGRLPASPAKKKTPVIVWFGRVLAPVAVAAAVTLAIVLPKRHAEGDIVKIIDQGVSQGIVADIPSTLEEDSHSTVEEISSEQVTGSKSLPARAEITRVLASVDKAASVPEQMAEAPADVFESFSEDSSVQAALPDEPSQSQSVETSPDKPSDKETAVERSLETEEFDYVDDEREKERSHRVKASITAFGDATSNTGKTTTKNLSVPSRHYSSAAPKFNAVTQTGESAYAIPLSFGVGTKINLTPRWALGVGVNYTLLSRTFAGNYREIDSDDQVHTTVYSSIHNRQAYIGVPLEAYFSIVKNNFVDFYTYAGGTAEHCVDNRYVMQGATGKKVSKDPLGGFQFSVNAGIGVEFIVADRVGFYLDPSVRYYFKGNHPESIRVKQPLTVGVEAGMRIRVR
ncbi:MAG: PorT family protein [Bacteroidales bacterium]|nr:PorT family protein [Bacteroidales bacterium]